MFKDITLGQFFPGDTFIHRLDPRSKILITILYIVIIFLIKNFVGYALLVIFLALCVINTKIPFKFMIRGLKPVVFFIILTAMFNIFLTASGKVYFSWRVITVTDIGVRNAAFMMIRLIMLILGTSLLTLTTSPIALTDGIESLLTPIAKIGFPAHEVSMMMSIALRFIPTLIEETDKIIKAQTARGADFESGNIIKRVRAMVPILIPLFLSAFRRADELATAMECRCYRGGKGRTRLRILKMGAIDAMAFLTSAILLAAVIFVNRLF